MVEQEQEITNSNLNTVTKEQLQEWKEKGFSDSFLADAWGVDDATFVKSARNFQFFLYTNRSILVLHNLKQIPIISTLVILVKMSKFQVQKEKLPLSAAVQFESARELNLIIALYMACLL